MDQATLTTIIIFIVNLLAAGAVGFFSAGARIGEYKNKVDTLERTIGVDEHGGLRRTLSEVKIEVNKFQEFKENTQKFIDKNLYEAHSPLSLSEFGKLLIDESGFTPIFEVVKDDLVHQLEAKAPRTQYDVQEMARGLMDELRDYPAFEPLKTYAFQHGRDFPQILRAGAIPLRDYYLERHPEITE